MPKNPLLVYIRDNLKKPLAGKKPGPVITIAREFGCSGGTVMAGLVAKINQKYPAHEEKSWKAIEKEIIRETADELELHPDIIERIAKEDRNGILSDMLHSTPYLPDDIKVKKTIAKTVYSLAQKGKVIILGRGGAVLTRDIESSLHIFLYAPKKWRIEQVMGDKKISREEAIDLINTVDRERIYLRNLFAGEEVSFDFYDACLSLKDFTVEQVQDEILHLAEVKNLLIKEA